MSSNIIKICCKYIGSIELVKHRLVENMHAYNGDSDDESEPKKLTNKCRKTLLMMQDDMFTHSVNRECDLTVKACSMAEYYLTKNVNPTSKRLNKIYEIYKKYLKKTNSKRICCGLDDSSDECDWTDTGDDDVDILARDINKEVRNLKKKKIKNKLKICTKYILNLYEICC